MKTSFHKFMASNAVQEVSPIKIEMAMDINSIIKAADKFYFEDMKIQSKAIGLLNEVQKTLASANQNPQPLMQEFENAIKQMATLGVETPKAFASSYNDFKKNVASEGRIKKAVLAKLFEIDKVFGGSGI